MNGPPGGGERATSVRIDVVIKIGGSLARTRALGALLDSIAGWRGRARILVVPGGGPFADLVRAEHHRLGLSESAAHRMAILAMDQYGLLLSDLASGALPVSRLDAIGAALRSGRLPIFLPSRSLLPRDPRSRLGHYRCVDRQFARWVRGIGSCWIVNGTRPARLREWLERGETLGTCVVVR